MSCCGKVGNIIKGNVRLAIGIKYEFTDDRIRICQKCEFNTWLKRAEYAKWLLSHGIEVLTNISDLTVLPELPKGEYIKGEQLFCRKCKCLIPAKARVESEKCPENKW